MPEVVAAAIGFFVAVLLNEVNHRRERQRRSEDAEALYVAESRSRARDAAAECDQRFLELARSMPEYMRAGRRRGTSDEDIERLGEVVSAALSRIDVLIVDLPEPFQSRVREGLSFVRDAGRLGAGGFGEPHHYQTDTVIAANTCEDMHSVLTAFLRNEPLPLETDRFLEYRVAYDEYQDALEWEFAQEIHEHRLTREEWLSEHGDLRHQLADRARSDPAAAPLPPPSLWQRVRRSPPAISQQG